MSFLQWCYSCYCYWASLYASSPKCLFPMQPDSSLCGILFSAVSLPRYRTASKRDREVCDAQGINRGSFMLCSILGNFLFKYKKRTSRIFSLCVERTRRVTEKKGEEKKRRLIQTDLPFWQTKQTATGQGGKERFQGREIKETKKDFFPPPRYSQLTSDFSTPFSFSFFCYVLAGTVPYHLLLLINKHGLSFVPFRHTPTLTMPFFFFFVLVTFSHFFSSIIIVYIIIIVTVLVINLLRLKYNPLT